MKGKCVTFWGRRQLGRCVCRLHCAMGAALTSRQRYIQVLSQELRHQAATGMNLAGSIHHPFPGCSSQKRGRSTALSRHAYIPWPLALLSTMSFPAFAVTEYHLLLQPGFAGHSTLLPAKGPALATKGHVALLLCCIT